MVEWMRQEEISLKAEVQSARRLIPAQEALVNAENELTALRRMLGKQQTDDVSGQEKARSK